MRNLLQYPLTQEEIFKYLDKSIDKTTKEDFNCGSLDAEIQRKIKAFLLQNKDKLEEFLKN